VCFICASPIDHTAIAPCNHQTCHICALRLRALYKTRACAHCRSESPFVIFTDATEKHFQDFNDQDFAKIDENLGIKFEKQSILEDTILLLRYNCPDQTCDMVCQSWPHLKNHVRGKHGKRMCDLCIRNKKVFAHEHEMFSDAQLKRHQQKGDDNPGAVDQSGFKGHPECGFCKERFYGDDELYTHCREKHERCHICDRQNGGRNPEYYLNYQALEEHFAAKHFVCLDPECQANKTNVFESEMDLKAHQLSEHAGAQSKDVRRDQRVVNLSNFDNVRSPYEPQRDRRGGRGRGRNPDAEPLPMSTAQNLSRAELAYQRQMAIQSAQSTTPRTFGGQLTQPAPRPQPTQQPRSPIPSTAQPANLTDPSPPSLDTLTLSASATPADRARTLRHNAVTERASNLLGHDAVKLSQFRTNVSSYRSGTLTASDLLDAFFSLFDCAPKDLGILIRELADLYENEARKTALLSAWNSWRSINEDYPSLPLPAGAESNPDAAGSMGANVGTGRRVLKLKSSTQQSSRSDTARQASWGSVLHPPPGVRAVPGVSISDAFPSLPTARRAPAASSIGWAGGASNSTPRPAATPTSKTTGMSSSVSSKNPRAPPRNTAESFPSLPASSKPLNTMISGFNTRPMGPGFSSGPNSKKGSGTATPVNPWANGGGNPTPAQAAAAVHSALGGDDVGADFDARSKKGKGKGKKKETLFHFG
jgi:E3 ubiquitin-protein ligase ZNF598